MWYFLSENIASALYIVVMCVAVIGVLIAWFSQETNVLNFIQSLVMSDNQLIYQEQKNYKKRYAKVCDYIKEKYQLYGEVTAVSAGDLQCIIYLNGEYFGIFDMNTHTFIE